MSVKAVEKRRRIVIDCAGGMRDAWGVKIKCMGERESEAQGASDSPRRSFFDE